MFDGSAAHNNQSPWVDLLVAAGAGAAADRDGHRLARSVAGGRAALRARGARHGRDRRLAAAARGRAAVPGQAAVVLLADRAGPATDAFVARRFPAAIVSRGIRLRRTGLRPRPPLVESRGRTRGARWRCCSRCNSCGRRGRRRSTRRCVSGRRSSLYGLLRHLLLGPSWRWYTIGWAAAGLGVITKGVGFLPLLVLIPFAMLRDPRWQPRKAPGGGARWLLGPLAFLAAVSIWLVPMLLAREQRSGAGRVSRRHPVRPDRQSIRQCLASSRAVLVLPRQRDSGAVAAAHAARAVAVRSLAQRAALVRSAHRVAGVLDRAGRAVLQSQHRQARRLRVAGSARVRVALCAISRAGRDASWGATCDVRAGCRQWAPCA